jgi:hypothetical protein
VAVVLIIIDMFSAGDWWNKWHFAGRGSMTLCFEFGCKQ